MERTQVASLVGEDSDFAHDVSTWAARSLRCKAFGLLSSLSLSSADKEDVFQQSLLALFDRASRGRHEVNDWERFFLAVCRYKAYALLRKEGARSCSSLEAKGVDADACLSNPDESDCVATIDVRLALCKLHDAYAAPLVMRAGGDSYADIAIALKVSPLAARQRVSRGRRLMRILLAG